MSAGCFCALSFSVLRNVVGETFQSLESAFCWKILISSWTKSRSVRHGPCSSTTTRNPAVESSFATTPPAAPDPTMAKSTSSSGRYFTVDCRSGASRGCVWSGILVVPAEGRSPREPVVEADPAPTHLLIVPAPLGVREHAGDRTVAEPVEELRLLFLHCGEDGDLLVRRERGERLRPRLRLGRARSQLLRRRHYRLLLVFGPGRDRLVDEVDDARLARAWRRVGRHDLRGSRFDLRRVVRRQRVELGRLHRVKSGGEHLASRRREPHPGGGGSRERHELPARKLRHVSRPPPVVEPSPDSSDRRTAARAARCQSFAGVSPVGAPDDGT